MAGPMPITGSLFGPLPYVNAPHRLSGSTKRYGVVTRRRVEVRDRRTGAYVVSTVTQDDGLFEFRRLPPQTLANPYVVTCFDDRPEGYGNALVWDRVYQVDDAGNPPQT
jgi:hypothetical protein